MASNDGDVAAGRSPTGEAEGSTSAASRFVVHETVSHWDVAEYKRLYPSTLDARRFGALFGDERNLMMFDRMGIRRDTDIGAGLRWWSIAGQ